MILLLRRDIFGVSVSDISGCGSTGTTLSWMLGESSLVLSNLTKRGVNWFSQKNFA